MPSGEDFCCGRCFGDSFLEERVEFISRRRRGICSFCETPDVALVKPEELRDWFDLLVAIYEPNDGGTSLVELLRGDWDLFHHPRLDRFRIESLLILLFGDYRVGQERYAPRPEYARDGVASWEELREELKYFNRYFPSARLDEMTLKREHLEQLLEPNVDSVWYRARLLTQDEPFSPEEMGAPPPRLATHGRANPAGIPYLYLSSTPETAASEVRPHTGEIACVADFTLDPGLQLVDLCSPRRRISPFKLASVEEIGQLRCNVSLLERLGEELTTPVVPQSAAVDYVPSQYLCEFIKRQGFDGVLYRSSVSNGVNLALFDPTRAKIGEVSLYSIDAVQVTVRAKTELIGVPPLIGKR